jgi:Rps23 Pro-64 3,4-dihydroxylase Tpa1-like proline 4-hydroxylase
MDMETLFTSNDNYIKDLNTQGFTIINNVLPIDLAEQIYQVYQEETNWGLINQSRENHYSHVFKSPNPFLPQDKEVYTARFNRSNSLESTNLIKDTFYNYFVPLLKKISPFPLTEYDIRCHKQDIGDHFRVHTDDYAGEINLIYYVNKDWRWDWGGILNVLSHEHHESIQSIFPKFNIVVLLNNKVFRAPHFVSTVEPFALNPRYSIVAFNK